MSNQKRVDSNCYGPEMSAPEKGEFRFDGSVKVGRSEMMREGIPKGRASMSKTTRGKSNVDTRFGEEIEGGREIK